MLAKQGASPQPLHSPPWTWAWRGLCSERRSSLLQQAVMDFPVFQGITLKLNDKQSCMVARIFHGGMIHRQGNKAS